MAWPATPTSPASAAFTTLAAVGAASLVACLVIATAAGHGESTRRGEAVEREPQRARETSAELTDQHHPF